MKCQKYIIALITLRLFLFTANLSAQDNIGGYKNPGLWLTPDFHDTNKAGYFSLYDDKAFEQEILHNSFSPDLKSESEAFHLSLWSTAVPVVASGVWILLLENFGDVGDVAGSISLGASGILIGPSMGYFYANKANRGLQGFGIRTGVGVSTLLLSFVFGKVSWDSVEPNAFLMTCGSGVILYSAIHDIIKVKQAVRDYNRNVDHQNSPAISPEYFPKYSATGFSVRIPL